MKAEKIAVKVGVTKNMGNYESLRLDYEIVAVLQPGEDMDACIDTARDHLFTKMSADVKAANGGKSWIK